MTVRFVLPAIHRRPTGGNVYNRYIAAELRKLPGLGGDVTLVDSLMLDHAPPGRSVLIAHYLNVIDPARRSTRAADRERKILARFEGIITTSDYSRKALRAEGVVNVETVWPGLHDRFRTPPSGSRDGPVLLTVASLLPGKGLLELIDILESLDGLDWIWILAGDATLDPAYARRLRARIARSPLSQRLRLRGPMPPSRLVALYDRASVFVLPTRFETCSMATREAMARGLPVVAYDTGGLRANLPRQSGRLLAPAGDAAALAAKLRRMLVDPDAGRVVGELNREAALAFPTWTESARKLWIFLRKVIDDS